MVVPSSWLIINQLSAVSIQHYTPLYISSQLTKVRCQEIHRKRKNFSLIFPVANRTFMCDNFLNERSGVCKTSQEIGA